MQFEVQGRKITVKEWRAFETALDANISHVQVA
jgi:hypothetical protein